MVQDEEKAVTASRKCEACTPKKDSAASKIIPTSENYKMMNGRPEEILQDGVWIRVQPTAKQSLPLAVQNAHIEEKRIHTILQEKEERIRKFRLETKARVSRITKVQQELLARDNSHTLREEQDIMYRSSVAADHRTPKKNNCLYNAACISIDASGIVKKDGFEDEDLTSTANPLAVQSQRSIQSQAHVRNKLLGRKLGGRDTSANANLPGGFWGTSFTRDKCRARLLDGNNEPTIDNCDVTTDETVETIKANIADNQVAIAAVQEGIMSSPRLRNHQKILSCISDLPSVLPSCDDSDKDSNVNMDELCGGPPPASALSQSKVHFKKDGRWTFEDVIPCENPPESSAIVTRMNADKIPANVKVHKCSSQPLTSITNFREVPPFVAPGAVEYKQRKIQERNRLICRRVFSHMERENVREGRRIRNHRIRVDRLKAEKERDRQTEEKIQEARVDAVATAMERQRIADEEAMSRRIAEEDKKIDKARKAVRYVAALRSRIRERLDRENIELPPMCGCANDFWSTDPKLCANNCVFYKNTAAYTKALQSVLSSVERNLGSTNRDSLHHHSVIYFEAEEKSTLSVAITQE